MFFVVRSNDSFNSPPGINQVYCYCYHWDPLFRRRGQVTLCLLTRSDAGFGLFDDTVLGDNPGLFLWRLCLGWQPLFVSVTTLSWVTTLVCFCDDTVLGDNPGLFLWRLCLGWQPWFVSVTTLSWVTLRCTALVCFSDDTVLGDTPQRWFVWRYCLGWHPAAFLCLTILSWVTPRSVGLFDDTVLGDTPQRWF